MSVDPAYSAARNEPAYKKVVVVDPAVLVWSRPRGSAFTDNYSLPSLAAQMLLVQGFGAYHETWNYPAWSISVELWANLAFGLYVWWLGRRSALLSAAVLALSGGYVLHQGDLSIACEISVTSTPEYEARNLAKCLRAGFARVWAIAPDAKRRKAIQLQAEARLGADDAGRVEYFTTEELILALDRLSVPEAAEKVVKGYRVTTTRKAISPNEALERRANIARILSRSARDPDS